MSAVFYVAIAVLVVLIVLYAYWTLLESIYPERIRTSEVYVITTKDLWKLRIYRYRKERRGGDPVLLVHGANANHNNFTSPEGGCLVDYLSDRGYDCWAIDLRGCNSCEPPFEHSRWHATIDDMLLYDIPAAIDFIREATGYEKLHWIGHSLGGMLLYAYVQKFGREPIASGTTLGAPLGFDDATLKAPAHLLPMVRLSPEFAGNCMRGYIPFGLAFNLNLGVFPINLDNLHPKMHTGNFYQMIEDPLPRVVKQLVNWLHSKNWTMLNGELDVAAGLDTIDLPLLAIYAPEDPFVTVEKGKEFIEKLPSKDKQILVCSKENGCKHDYDHCDLAFGEYGAREVFAPVEQWLQQHPVGAKKDPGTKPGGRFMPKLATHDREAVLSGTLHGKTATKPSETASTTTEEAAPDEKPAAKRKTGAAKKSAATKSTKSKAKTKSASKAKTKTKPASKTKSKAAAKSKSKTKARPKTKSAAKSKAKSTPKTAAKKTSATKSKAKPKTKAKSKTKPKTKSSADGKKKAAAKKKTIAKKKTSAKKSTASKKKAAAKKSSATKKKAATGGEPKPSKQTRQAILNASKELEDL